MGSHHRAAWVTEIIPTTHPSHFARFRPIAKAHIQSLPTSHAERLAGNLGETFLPNLPKGKSLSIFGFVTEIPNHLGVNKALDFSVEAICFAHRALLQADAKSLERSRTSYGAALIQLRQSLGHSQSSGEIPCAAMLLSIYEVCAVPVKNLSNTN